jgi:hypothetical protein
MTGYDGYSRSNNAIEAESHGRFPASVLARKLGVKTSAVRELAVETEWHHTSKKYNTTPYFDGACLVAVAAGDDASFNEPGHDGMYSPECDYHTLDDAKALLAALKAWKKAAPICHVCGGDEHPIAECPEIIKARQANRTLGTHEPKVRSGRTSG